MRMYRERERRDAAEKHARAKADHFPVAETVGGKAAQSAKGLSRDLASVLKYDDEKELEAAVEMIGNMQGAKAETKPDRRLIIENKLPDTHTQRTEPDQFRKAFGLTN